MTDTTEAVRLEDDLAPIAGLMPGGKIAKVVALLRRIPELEAERDQLRAELEKVRGEISDALALFPIYIESQTFRIYGHDKPLEADDDTQFYSKKKVIALLEKLHGHLTTAAPTPPHADQKGQ